MAQNVVIPLPISGFYRKKRVMEGFYVSRGPCSYIEEGCLQLLIWAPR